MTTISAHNTAIRHQTSKQDEKTEQISKQEEQTSKQDEQYVKQEEQYAKREEQYARQDELIRESNLKQDAFTALSNPICGFSYTNEFKNTEEGLKFKDGGNYTIGEMLSNGVAKMDKILNQVTGGKGSVASYEDMNNAMNSSGYDTDFAKIMDVNNDQSITGDELFAFSVYQDLKASELAHPQDFLTNAKFDGFVNGREAHNSKYFIKNNQDTAKAEIAQLHKSLNLSA